MRTTRFSMLPLRTKCWLTITQMLELDPQESVSLLKIRCQPLAVVAQPISKATKVLQFREKEVQDNRLKDQKQRLCLMKSSSTV